MRLPRLPSPGARFGGPAFAKASARQAARSSACLANQNLQNQLMQTSSDATTQFPEFSGTPTFILNGEQLKQTATWDKLEPAIRDALGS